MRTGSDTNLDHNLLVLLGGRDNKNSPTRSLIKIQEINTEESQL